MVLLERENGKPKKRFRRRVGDIVSIKLEDGDFCFARVLDAAGIAFYDMKRKSTPSIEEILFAPILFTIPVMKSTITSGRWEVIGNRPLEPELMQRPRYFMQDMLTGKFGIYQGGIETPATRQEIQGLERFAVWSAHHVEGRLRDHFAGVPNKTLEHLQPDKLLAKSAPKNAN